MFSLFPLLSRLRFSATESCTMTNPIAVLNGLLLLAGPVVQPLAAQALVVGDQKQLFVDHRFIESSEGITLRMNPPYQTGEPLVVVDRPWEAGAKIHVYCSVLKEEGPEGVRIRLWYDLYTGAGRPLQGFRALCYAESNDGIQFKKPVLGLVEKDGSRENNLVMPTDLSVMTVGGGSVGRDDNPDARPKSGTGPGPSSTPFRERARGGTPSGTRRTGFAGIWRRRSPPDCGPPIRSPVGSGIRRSDAIGATAGKSIPG